MKKAIVVFLLLACAFAIPSPALAAPIRAYVTEFAVTPPESGGLKATLQTLLSSRMASESITPVGAASEADVIIAGSLTQLGKVFSLDAVARSASGRTVATVFEQGESQDDLIPAIGRVSAKLKAELLLRYPQPAPAAPAAAAPSPSGSAAPAPVGAAPQPAAAPGTLGTTTWLSPRIAGAQLGLAPALGKGDGRGFFVAEPHALRLYRQEKGLKLLAEVQLPLRENVIAVDSAGPDQSGNPRVYLTVMDGEKPASRIYSYENGGLKLVADRLPYLFRAIALNGGARRIYAQEMGMTEDYYGDLYEMSDNGTSVEKKSAYKLPRYANIFNYTTVQGPDGKSYVTVLSTDGFLVVYSEAGEEIWRSTEKFGGSETYFQREAGANVKETYEKFRRRFLDQRITATADGGIIVPQNSGFFVLGNSRSYSKYALVSFTWNGSSMEERWRTKQNQNYLADYFYEPGSRELVLLETVQKEGLFGKGGSAIRVMRAD